MRRIFSLCCQDLARDLFTRTFKAGKPDSATSPLSACLGRHKICCTFQEYAEWKVNGERVGGVSAAKECDGMGGCTLAAFLQAFEGVIGILY